MTASITLPPSCAGDLIVASVSGGKDSTALAGVSGSSRGVAPDEAGCASRAATPQGWKIVPAFPGYRISETGVVVGLVRGVRMKPRIDDSGYFAVTLHRGREVKRARVHRLVAAAFLGPCPSGLVVNHCDGNKLNNHHRNLEYVTPAENVRHAVRMGLHKAAQQRVERRLAKRGSR